MHALSKWGIVQSFFLKLLRSFCYPQTIASNLWVFLQLTFYLLAFFFQRFDLFIRSQILFIKHLRESNTFFIHFLFRLKLPTHQLIQPHTNFPYFSQVLMYRFLYLIIKKSDLTDANLPELIDLLFPGDIIFLNILFNFSRRSLYFLLKILFGGNFL